MENSGRQKFEESWKEAFEDSEMEPSGSVWNSIDQKLDNDKMKRSVLFYQRLAAAAVIFAVLIGVASTSYFKLNSETELASTTKTENQKTQQELSADTKNTSSINKGDNEKQTELATSETSTTSSKADGSDKNVEATSESERATQGVTTKQYDKQNQSVAQVDEKADQRLKEKAGDQTNKSMASAKGDLSLKSKNVNSLNTSQASVKSNSVKEKRNSDQNNKMNSNATTQPLIAKADNKKNGNGVDDLNQQSSNEVASKSNASKAKSDTKQSNGKDNVTTLPLIAQADHIPNTNGTNDLNKIASVKLNSSVSKNDVEKNKNTHDVVNPSLVAQGDTKEIVGNKSIQNGSVVLAETNTFASSPQSIQSSDNAFSRMASYVSPQLKNNKLYKGMEPEPKRELPAMPASMMASSRSDKRSNEESWLSLGAAAGSYNPGNAPSYNQSLAFAQQYATATISNAQAPQSTTRSSMGSAYSVGLSFGKKVADRWIVQTGVNYMNQAISYTSNYTTYDASNNSQAFVADYASKTSAPIAITQPYKVNSVNDFVSVPVQAGYLIVDRKFGMQWNAGVATDVFLRNTLKDESGRSDKHSQGSGEDSPYRSFNFAALTSTEFSYRLGGQYRISLVPGVRYSFQSVLKSQSGAASNPLVLDIGFRFRYIFNTK